MNQNLFTQTTLLRQKPDVLASAIDHEVVIYDDAKEVYFGMNLLGSEIWQNLREPKRIADLISDLRTKYEVSEENCKGDVEIFLRHLIEKNLIEIIESK